MAELLKWCRWEPQKTFMPNNIDFVGISIKEYSTAYVLYFRARIILIAFSVFQLQRAKNMKNNNKQTKVEDFEVSSSAPGTCSLVFIVSLEHVCCIFNPVQACFGGCQPSSGFCSYAHVQGKRNNPHHSYIESATALSDIQPCTSCNMCLFVFVHISKCASAPRNTQPAQVAAGDDHHECNWSISLVGAMKNTTSASCTVSKPSWAQVQERDAAIKCSLHKGTLMQMLTLCYLHLVARAMGDDCKPTECATCKLYVDSLNCLHTTISYILQSYWHSWIAEQPPRKCTQSPDYFLVHYKMATISGLGMRLHCIEALIINQSLGCCIGLWHASPIFSENGLLDQDGMGCCAMSSKLQPWQHRDLSAGAMKQGQGSDRASS